MQKIFKWINIINIDDLYHLYPGPVYPSISPHIMVGNADIT